MIVISLQREKCIGCNYCVEMAPAYFQMSKKDGKSVLLNASQRKEFQILKEPNTFLFDELDKASKSCPVHIISVLKTKS